MDLFACRRCGFTLMKGEMVCPRCGAGVNSTVANRPIRDQVRPVESRPVTSRPVESRPVASRPTTSIPEKKVVKTKAKASFNANEAEKDAKAKEIIKTFRIIGVILFGLILVIAIAGYIAETKVFMPRILESETADSEQYLSAESLASKFMTAIKFSGIFFFASIMPLWLTISVMISAINIIVYVKMPVVAWFIVLAEIILSCLPIIIRVISGTKGNANKYKAIKVIYFSSLATSSFFLATMLMLTFGLIIGFAVMCVLFIASLIIGVLFEKNAVDDFNEFDSNDYDGDFYVELGNPD